MRRQPLKNRILKSITAIMAVMAALGVMMLDSENLTIPIALCAVSFSWLVLFASANE